jgi:hypothetical protein
MKVALCFLISYKHVVYHERVWREWIAENADICNVYFHYQDRAKIRSPWVLRHCIPPHLVQATAYFNVVPAYMAVLSYAFKHDLENQWFCLLTESCAPAVSPAQFREQFWLHADKTVMGVRPAYWNITMHRRANLRLLQKEYWLANDPWFTLCRKHVHQCLLFLSLRQDVYKQVNDGGLANESLFAIVLQTFGETDGPRHLNACGTVADWSRMSSPTSPCVLTGTEEDRRAVRLLLDANPYAMFVRKVSPRCPAAFVREWSDPLRAGRAWLWLCRNRFMLYWVLSAVWVGVLCARINIQHTMLP